MMELNLKTIEQLINLVTEKNLAELTLEQEDQKVTIKTSSALQITPAALAPSEPIISAQPIAQPPQIKPVTEESSTSFYRVTSPMVGTFYRSPSPTSPPFVEVGSMVAKGQTLCIIEAMKMMNELESEVTGVVKKIFTENGTAVEFGQLIMEIEVSSN